MAWLEKPRKADGEAARVVEDQTPIPEEQREYPEPVPRWVAEREGPLKPQIELVDLFWLKLHERDEPSKVGVELVHRKVDLLHLKEVLLKLIKECIEACGIIVAIGQRQQVETTLLLIDAANGRNTRLTVREEIEEIAVDLRGQTHHCGNNRDERRDEQHCRLVS